MSGKVQQLKKKKRFVVILEGDKDGIWGYNITKGEKKLYNLVYLNNLTKLPNRLWYGQKLLRNSKK
jgi:hypothetical protein